MLAVSSLLTAGASRTADRPAARPAKRAAAARWRGVDGGRGPGRRGVRHAGQHAGAFAGAPLPSLCRRVSSVSARGLLDRLFGGGAEAASDEAAEEEAELVAAADLPFTADLPDEPSCRGPAWCTRRRRRACDSAASTRRASPARTTTRPASRSSCPAGRAAGRSESSWARWAAPRRRCLTTLEAGHSGGLAC